MTKDNWVDIPEYEGLYQINADGEVRSLARTVLTKYGWMQKVRGRLLKPQRCSNGYYFYPLCKNGVVKGRLIHRLVMQAFVGDSVLEVNHKDGNKKNNSLENLEYVTHSQNQLHSYRVLKTEPVRSWLGKRGFEHNKSIHVLITNVETGETKAFGSYRLAHENGFDRQQIKKFIDTNKLLFNKYKIERL